MSTALTSVNTVAFSPMPRARAMMATPENHRSLTISRAAKRRSCSTDTPRGGASGGGRRVLPVYYGDDREKLRRSGNRAVSGLDAGNELQEAVLRKRIEGLGERILRLD